MANIYISSVAYAAVTPWSAALAVLSTDNGGRGTYIRQLATPAVGSSRVFRCTTSGTTHATTEPTWALTKNATTADNTAVWTECTGQELDQGTGTLKAPHVRLANAWVATWGAAGDVFYCGGDHAYSIGAAYSLVSPGTVATSCRVQCVVVGCSIPPVAADIRNSATSPTGIASEATTGAFGLAVTSGYTIWDGIHLSGGSGATNLGLTFGFTAAGNNIFKNGKLSKPGTTANTAAIVLGTTIVRVTLDNVQCVLGAAGDQVTPVGMVEWKNSPTAFSGTLPTIPFRFVSAGTTVCTGLGLSMFDAGETLVNSTTGQACKLAFVDCTLGASVVVASGMTRGAEVHVVNCDSGATNYRQEKLTYEGDQTMETTIVRTGGASDGVTPVAWKIITTAGASFSFPFESLPIPIWNDTTGTNRVVTVCGIWGGGAVPLNDEIWMELFYLGSASTPIATLNISNRKATFLTTAGNQGSDGSTWGGSTTPFKMAVTLSAPQPAMKGYIYAIIKCGKASSTFYVDPKVVLT